MDPEKVSELLGIYMELVEKQDEVILMLSRLAKMQHTELAQLRTILNCECPEEAERMREAMQKVDSYNSIKEV